MNEVKIAEAGRRIKVSEEFKELLEMKKRQVQLLKEEAILMDKIKTASTAEHAHEIDELCAIQQQKFEILKTETALLGEMRFGYSFERV